MNKKIINKLRFFWRLYLLLINFLHNFVIILLSSLYFLILLLLFLSLGTKRKGYFIGIQELCDNINSTKFALNAYGFRHITTLGIKNHFNENNSYDHVVKIPEWMKGYPNLRKYYIFSQTAFYLPKFLYAKEYFIFFWNRTFLPLNMDLLLLKFLKKKVVIFHCGDDVRFRPIHNKLMEKEGVKYRFPDLMETFPNLIFIQKLFYQKFPNFLNIPIYTLMDIETFLDRGAYHFRVCQKDYLEPNKKTNNDIPVVVHAPSHRELKGTQIVLDAIEILQVQNIQFNFLLLENKNNNEVIEILKKTDIVIDQPGLWPGRLAIEGMAHSCIILGGSDSKYENCQWNLPILPFIKDAIKLAEEIKKALDLTQDRLFKYRCFQAYEKYYSSKIFVEHLNSVLEGKAEKELFPHPLHKEKLLEAAENFFQRLMIKIFVN